MGYFGLACITLPLSAFVSACAGIAMTKHIDERMSFSQDVVGTSRPSQPTSLVLDGEVAYLKIRNSARDPDTGTGYLGIGEYALPATPELRLKFGLLAKALSSQPLPSPKPGRHQNIFRYDFSLAGKAYSGTYDFSLGKDFNSKLKSFGEIKSAILNSGTPVVGFRPEVSAQASDGQITISLKMLNTGETPLEFAGPSAWHQEEGERTVASVAVGISPPGGVGSVYYLGSEHLIAEDSQYCEVISIEPANSVTLRFLYPMRDAVASPVEYVVAARMVAMVLAPKRFEGPIETGLDVVRMVY